VSAGIEGIFPDDDYKFDIGFVQRRGATEADIVLVDGQGNAIRPRDAEGGGLIQVASFLLRIACWSLTKATRPTFLLDEPFSFLHSREAHARIANLVKGVAETGIQIVMVTGEDESEEIVAGADRVFRVDRGKVRREK
jgi:ABC-type thiamine transport system ATPase subunit